LSDPLRAAGGIVARDGRVLLVHRPARRDWTFPKGKLETGESWEDAALREVEEETALVCELGSYVASTTYEVARGTKEVRWFHMTAIGDALAQNEVDEVRWVTPDEAQALLTYERDRELLRSSLR
jgi:8-oxo-dGTP diphosphatase